MSDQPETYAGEAPHNGVAPSRWAADEAFPKLAARQKVVLIWLSQETRRERGGTVKEFRDQEKFHHGTASSLFTTLHMRGRLVALQETRDGATVYVLPEFVNGRETRPYARMKRKGMTADIADVVRQHTLVSGVHVGVVFEAFGCSCGARSFRTEDPYDEHAEHLAEEITRRIG